MVKSSIFKKNFYTPERNREVFYEDFFSKCGVKLLELYEYCDKDLEIIVTIFDYTTYSLLIEELIGKNFSRPSYIEDLFYTVTLRHPDKTIIAKFLKIITRVDENFLETEKEIFRILNIDQPLPAKVVPLPLSTGKSTKYTAVITKRSDSLTENFKAKAKL